ncbi:MAG TPA: hypothetical protein PKW44_07695 [Methylophilaceae bacterium]|jgi:outer membrane protein assembly factor BamE (lipoprotein component of BamABCDE complex)|nr:hypothetical protein [Methylophilaceae bacterium]
MRIIAPLLLFIALSGCASYDGSGLKPGSSTTADVVQAMGTPAMRWNEPGGGELLAFPRGPSGTETFMVRIAANGILASKENVLDMRHFAQIQAGMTEQEVLRVIGPPFPGWTATYPARSELVWEWRYCSEYREASRFDVIFDSATGKVKTTQSYVESIGRGHPRC